MTVVGALVAPAAADTISDVEIRRRRSELGGRAQDRLRGKGLQYIAHDTPWGGAAARRRRQMARRGVLGCAACLEPTQAERSILVGDGQRVCIECAIAAGLPIVPLPEVDGLAADAVDPDLHTWEGEGGAPE